MDAVPQFMRQRGHIARIAQIIEEDIGIGGGDGRGGECAAALVRQHRRVNPVSSEELLRHLFHPRAEVLEGFKHDIARLLPNIESVALLEIQRRVTIVIIKLLISSSSARLRR